MNQVDHNKIIKSIGKMRLEPFGIFQKGQSRIFLKDYGWYTIVIEFQPSSLSKGTHLNIGVDLNIYPREYFTFGYGYREKKFVEYQDENQFTTIINEHCDFIIKKIDELSVKFQDLFHALNTWKGNKGDKTWIMYELAILYALNGKYDKSRRLIKTITKTSCKYDWELERKEIATKILGWLQEPENANDKIINLIYETRNLKKLPFIDLKDILNKQFSPSKSVVSWIKDIFK